MSVSDDKFIPHHDPFRQIGEICAPHLKGLGEQQAERLEREANELEFEAEAKRYLAKRIRKAVQS